MPTRCPRTARTTHRAVAALLLAVLMGCSGSDPGAMPEVLAIAEARGLALDSEATIEGYVTAAPGTFQSAIGDQGFALQDKTGGIYVSVSQAPAFGLGDHVRVHGTLTEVAEFTTLEANEADVEVISGTQAVAPVPIATGEVGEPNEGLLVEIQGTVTQPVVDDSPYGFKVYLDDGSGEIQVFVHLLAGAPVIDLSGLDVDVALEVVGLSAQYEATREVTPRIAEDLRLP